MWLATLLVLGASWLIYWLLGDVYNYWKRKGVPHLRGRFPNGSMRELLSFERYLGYVHQKAYRLLEPHPYGGIYVGRVPVLLLRDPEIIGRILVNDFSHFRDRDRISESSWDGLSKNILRATAELWKTLRIQATPAFSSGKMRNMFVYFEECARQLDTVLEVKAANKSEVNIKDLILNFTLDVTCSCGFGLEVNSISNPDNDIRRIGLAIFPLVIPRWKQLALSYSSVFPGLAKLIKTRMYAPEVTEVLTRVVQETVDYRRKNKITRNDFLDLLIEASNEESERTKSGGMTAERMAAQCLGFLAGGLETSAAGISFCLYELALNPEIQEKVRSEIDKVSAKCGGLTYDAMKEMSYLDQVISEAQRKYPSVQYLNRTCTKTYRIPGTDIDIDEGTLILIPIYALHHDPDHFPDPETFDPERFSEDRKSSIKHFSYLPFGEGPRNCLGMKFGQLEMKMGICTILSKYKVQRSGRTPVPLEFTPTHLASGTKDPIYLRLVKRHDE